MYNVHLPIMLEGERQAVYRERKKEKDVAALGNPGLTGAGAVTYHSGWNERERDDCFALIVFLMSCFC